MSTIHENDCATTPKEKLKQIMQILPGVDCGGFGGCGKPTCEACAKAIAEGESIALCPACKQDAVNEIAKVMGVEPVTVKDEIAFIQCNGAAAGKERLADCKTCDEAVKRGFVDGECKNGCVGIGSCIDLCKFDAMKLVDGKVIVDREKCTGCLACINSCPQKLISMVPSDATNFIPCASTLEEDATRSLCGYGCLGCGDCEETCPRGAIKIVENHAVIDYEKCVGCVACTVICKKKMIVDTLHDLTKIKEEVAFVRCNGGIKSHDKYEALGVRDCWDVVNNYDAKEEGLCGAGCTGQGNCTRVCRYDAIHVVNGTSVVDPEKCVGCKDCTFACPKELIVMVPYKGTKLVPCASKETLEEKQKVCQVGCIACEDCKNNCPNGAIHMEDMHAVVDTELCENCGICSYVCPRELIKEQPVPEYNYMQRDALGIKEGE
ncbi:MAG: 4Fe-4S binding protein [Anaerovoracaceae bacterium]